MRRGKRQPLGWTPALPPITYLEEAARHYRPESAIPNDKEMLESLRHGLTYELGAPRLLPALLDAANWSERVRTEQRRPRVMLDANLNQAGTFQIGLSLLSNEPPICLTGDFDDWINRGMSPDWAASWQRPKREFTHFKHVGMYVCSLSEHNTDLHRYCILAAIAEFERIKRVLAFDLDLIAAARFEQTWVNGHLASVTFRSLDVVLREAAVHQR